MESFNFDNVKAEKANAMIRYNRLQKIANLFRFFEIFGAVLFLSWFATKLPLLLTTFSHYLKTISVLLISPHVVFLIGNAIIITIFAKSGHFPGQNATGNNPGDSIYQEFVKNSEKKNPSYTFSESTTSCDMVVYQDKQIVCENKVTSTNTTIETCTNNKVYTRSQSENLNKFSTCDKPKQELQRSKTMKHSQRRVPGEKVEIKKWNSHEEEMSTEEFQRKIDAFIEKQLKFRIQESMAIVVNNF